MPTFGPPSNNPGNVALDSSPPYVSGSHSGPYEGRANFYGNPATVRAARAVLAQAATGVLKSFAFLGDSKTSGGAGGSVNDQSKAHPSIMRSLLPGVGIPSAGTGFCPVGGVATADGRTTRVGAWADGLLPMFTTGPNAATITFVSDSPGTVVDVYYLTTSGTFTVTIDGGAAVPVNPAGGNNLAKYEVVGLPNTVHTILITATAANCLISGVEVRGTAGLRCHNWGVGGAKASDWTSTVFSNRGWVAGQVAILAGCDLLAVELGVNDIAGAVSNAAFIANLETIFGNFPGVPALLVVESAPAAQTDSAWTAYVNNSYAVADALGIGLLDLRDRWGPSATNQAIGMIGVDGLHETVGGYVDKAQAHLRAILG